MKSWVSTLLVIGAGYFLYSTWFGSDGDDSAIKEPPRGLHVDGADGSDTGGDPHSVGGANASADAADAGHAGHDASSGTRSFRFDAKRQVDAAKRRERQVNAAAAKLDAARHAAIEHGDEKAAAKVAAQILNDHPTSRAAGWVHFDRGRAAYAIYQEEGRNKRGLTAGKSAWHDWTRALFLADADEADRAELRDRLDQLAQDLVFGPRHVEGIDFMHTPRRGDTLAKLCVKTFRGRGSWVGPGFIATVNGMRSPRDLRAQEPIKVPKGRLSVRVVKSEYRLYVLLNGNYLRSFPVGLGRAGGTPEATFELSSMNKNPDWYPKAGVKIPYGHPDNILGTRWMGFKNSAEFRGFGIHGTANPESIGREESSGCVRMLNRDVELLFDWLLPRTEIVIVR